MLSKAERTAIIAELRAVLIGLDLNPPEFEKWNDSALRREYISKYGFPLLGYGFDQLVEVLKTSHVLAVCSGLAYYERRLLDQGVNIIASDLYPPPETWMPVEKLDLYAAMSKYQDRDTIFCSWPIYRTFIREFPPHIKRVILIGECYDYGCCDNLDSHNGKLIMKIDIPQWECIYDQIYVYEF